MSLIQRLLKEKNLKYKWDMDGYHESMNYRPLVIYHNENAAYFLVATERAIWANQIPIVELKHSEGGVPIFLKCLEASFRARRTHNLLKIIQKEKAIEDLMAFSPFMGL